MVPSGIGIDIINIERFKRATERWGEKFLKRIFTSEELSYCFKRKNPYPCLAGRFAVKEAVIKASNTEGLSYRQIEVRIDEKKKPVIFLRGKKLSSLVSLSHERDYAVAVVVMNEGPSTEKEEFL